MTIRKASRPKPPKTRETSGPASELILYQTEDGRTRIECRFEDETIWLSQALMADLFQTSVQNVNLHILNILEDGEAGEATIRDYLIVRTESGGAALRQEAQARGEDRTPRLLGASPRPRSRACATARAKSSAIRASS